MHRDLSRGIPPSAFGGGFTSTAPRFSRIIVQTGCRGTPARNREIGRGLRPYLSHVVLPSTNDMLSFIVYRNRRLAESVDLSGAYVIGTDDVPLRAECGFRNGVITCKKRAAGPAGLVLLWEVKNAGAFLLETIRVQEREQPYVLQVELARGRLMRLLQKLEEWGLNEFDGAEPMLAKVEQARDALIRSLQCDTPQEAAELGEESVSLAVQAGEEAARFHAAAFLGRRKQTGGFNKRLFGCHVPLDKSSELSRKRIASAFDFATLPVIWRDVEPTEQNFNWKTLDGWIEGLARQSIYLRGGPLLSFHEKNVPDWLFIWEHDFDTLRDLAFEHIRRVINRYSQYIQTWTVVSGLHSTNCFTFSFEQLMELTRMAAALTKQVCPRGTAIIELVAPWGEYYARNQRTIPPLLYADMTVQGGVNFDAFGLQFRFGPAIEGLYVRDMFQISCLLDHFSKLGKPIHVTAVQVPSESSTGTGGASSDGTGEGGSWHDRWSENVQAEWLARFVEVVLSKPYVESVCWQTLTDQSDGDVRHGGLLRSDLTPKAAYKRLLSLRGELLGPQQKTADSAA